MFQDNEENSVNDGPVSEFKILCENLPELDFSIVEKNCSLISKYAEQEQYEQLSLLCQNKAFLHPDWLLLSGQIKMKYIKKIVPKKFSESTHILRPILNEEYYKFVMEHKEKLDSMIKEKEDMNFNIFSVETLLKSYLARIKKDNGTTILETPQYMYMRVACFLWFDERKKDTSKEPLYTPENSLINIEKMYKDLSNGKYSMASPTMFNAGLFKSQLASCFLYNLSDSMQSISKGWHDAAIISMNSGGLGIDFTSLRHSEIGQHGETSGIIPWIKITNQILLTVDQGSKRKGSGTAYLTCWHIDIEEFLDLRKATGPEDMRARDMFYALSVSDEFMRRVEKDQDWTLFCPNKVPKLETKWGMDFEIAYRGFEKKVSSGKIVHCRVIKARELWKKIILTQIETGMPYILYKDAINRKSNQKNLGTTRLSNLCAEITLFTDKDNIASCNLGSIALNSCINWNTTTTSSSNKPSYNFDELEYLTREMVRNVNQMIDRNYYPQEVPQIKYTNLRNRPIGVGVQGLADVFAILDLPWTSPEARKLNEMIFETMYYGAISESVEMAKEFGAYETFQGSPASEGLFQFDLWDLEKVEKEFENKTKEKPFVSSKFIDKHLTKRRGTITDRYNWEKLRADMVKYGMRNSMLMALMPTASSASILGNNESMEAYTQHIYARTVLSGQFVMINNHLVRDFKEIGLWNTEVVRNIWKNSGSVANISEDISDLTTLNRLKFLKEKYLTIFEIPQKVLLDMALDRGRYVCQTQSFNCWMKDPTYTRLNAFHFYGWKGGAKTGMYYLRQTAKTDPTNFSLDSINIPTKKQLKNRNVVCDEEVCVSCSS
jgi:ribonucleoside-diphosphate reductase alpha chain